MMTSGDALVNPWIYCPAPNARARLRLFCFPYAGRGASVFRRWPHRMPPGVEVCAVQYPGREQRLREAPCTRMQALVEGTVKAIRPHLDIPYVIFGHSLGALAGFEVTRQLRRDGCRQPQHLVLSGHRAPHLSVPYGPISHLPQGQFVAVVCERYNGIPAEVLAQPELLDLLVPTLRADIELLETYYHQAEPPVSCPITCFGGLDDAEATPEHLNGWCRYTEEGFRLQMFPGGHFFLQSAEERVLTTMGELLLPLVDGDSSWSAEKG